MSRKGNCLDSSVIFFFGIMKSDFLKVVEKVQVSGKFHKAFERILQITIINQVSVKRKESDKIPNSFYIIFD